MHVRSTSKKIFDVFNILIFIIVCLSCILPFVHLMAMSFSSNIAIINRDVIFRPVGFNLNAYAFAFQNGRFMTALFISLRRIGLGVPINLLLIVLTAYPLSHNSNRLFCRNVYMVFFIFTMIFSGGLIPTFIVVTRLGLLNSIWALILPGALPVFSMIVVMNFIRGLPEELQESAMIDGAGSMTVLFRILMPLLKPSLATVALFSIVAHWNSWVDGLIYMQNPMDYPLQTYLHFLLNQMDQIMQGGGAMIAIMAELNAQSGRAAQLFLGSIPILLVYPFLQRYFTKGLVMGSVKG